jgi:hypothetical protein
MLEGQFPTEDNGPCDFLRGETREDSTIAIDSLFLASASVDALFAYSAVSDRLDPLSEVNRLSVGHPWELAD